MSKLTEEKSSFLNSIYYGRGQAGSFGSAFTLWKAARKKKPGFISHHEVKEYLRGQKTHTLNKRLLRRHLRRKYLAFLPGECLQIDIIYLSNMKSIAKKKRLGHYALTCFDVFTKKAEAVNIHDKSAASALKGFKSILNKWGIIPSLVQSDFGKEFEGPFRKWCEEQNIKLYSSRTNVKSALVENFNGQLKKLLSKHASFFNTGKWSEFLADAVTTYNSNPTKALPHQMSPNEASDEQNISALQTFYFKRRADFAQKIKKRRKQPKYKPGDKVRVLRDHYAFTRGFRPKFSDQVYSVEGLTNTIPVMITVRDGPSSRKYYEDEVAFVYDKKGGELDEPEILSIKSARLRELPTLRSGKTRGAPTQEFLTVIEGVTSPKYLREEEIKKYINGDQKLSEFLKKGK